jgi:DNA-binding MarR family transcriptional regulator
MTHEEDARQLVRLAARLVRHTQRQADAVPSLLQRLLDAEGLGPRHLHALIPLALRGPMMVSRLADDLALAPATTSQLVNELARAGLVERGTDPADRRRAVVAVRADLADALAGVADRRLQPFRDALAGLEPGERAAFLRGWQLLVEAHDARSAKDAP